MRSNSTHPMTRNTFETLSGIRRPNCISIYLPMFKKGKEQNQEMGPSTLKTHIHNLEKVLSQHGLKEQEITQYLTPLQSLVTDRELWRNPGEGLAIFLDDTSGLQYFVLPLTFTENYYVSDHFYLLPLLPLYHQNGQYYVLSLSRDHIKLYEADRYGLKDLFLETHAPERLEEVVGFDYEQKTLQFRTGQAEYAQGAFHGHGEGKDDEKLELLKFFKEVNKGVNALVGSDQAPLLIAGVSRWHALYKEVNTYPNLFEEALLGDPEFKDQTGLHQETWELIAPYFTETLHTKVKAYRDKEHLENTSHQISDIVPAAKNGRVDTLFVRSDADHYGTYTDKQCLILDTEKTPKNRSLFNMVALDTFLQGGKVYVLDEATMPYPKRPLNALFRY